MSPPESETQPKPESDHLPALQNALQAAAPPRPRHVRPIVILGSGGIVRAAHLPAYQKAGFPVLGVMDSEDGKAAALAYDFGIPRAFQLVAELVRFAPSDAVYDVAVPASQLPGILTQLPDGATVLMQKPMGETLAEARLIRDLCRQKGFTAAVNFSFRYSPNHLAAQAIAAAGLVGVIHDLEVQVRTYTPWHLWPFLAHAPRLEILYHSIHYLDITRCWFGEPRGVKAVTVRNPTSPNLSATKSSILLNYDDFTKVLISTNHGHSFGPAHAESFLQWEGTLGVVRIGFGVNLDYPHGRPDTLEYMKRGATGDAWMALPLTGNTFPDGFSGTMGALQSYVEGAVPTLPSSFEDAFKTMALVEACYRSCEHPGEPVLIE